MIQNDDTKIQKSTQLILEVTIYLKQLQAAIYFKQMVVSHIHISVDLIYL